MKKNTIERDLKLFKVSSLVLVVCLALIILTSPLTAIRPDYERNIFDSISSFSALLLIVFMELTTIFYYRSRGKYAHLENFEE